MAPETFYSNGKLLLTGEYVVLDGALSLALPTKLGQSMTVEEINEPKVIWESYDLNGKIWFETEFKIVEFAFTFIYERVEGTKSTEAENTLLKILFQIGQQHEFFFNSYINRDKGFKIITKLDFPKNWGLGSSSTLINNLANWAKVDAYQLLAETFGGSGYDIACAQHDSPILYQIEKKERIVEKTVFDPKFKDCLYFVYLNKKQNSRDGIAKYRANTSNVSDSISEISEITRKIIICNDLNQFESLINSHENIISKIIKQKPIKEILFHDFEGSIKSLGAWGGDFVMATSHENPLGYFKSKGFETVVAYRDMIK